MADRKETGGLVVGKKRWAAYAAAGAVASLVGSPAVEADIVHIVVDAADGDLGSEVTLTFALDGGADLYFNHGATNSARVFVSSGAIAGVTSSSFNYAANLNAGVNISTQGFLSDNTSAYMAYASGDPSSNFVDQSGFIGFRFDLGDGDRFGWVRVTSNQDSPVNTFVIEEYAFGGVGDAVAVGQTAAVPEPASLGLLAVGAAGVVVSRRRRRDLVLNN